MSILGIDRIGIDLGPTMRMEEAITWAAQHGVHSIDIRPGEGGNSFDSFDAARVTRLRDASGRGDVRLALHTLSAVNAAETAPYLSEAVDEYLMATIRLAGDIGAAWVVVHAGYHFTDDFLRRRDAGLDRLHRMGDLAQKHGVPLLLENMNPGPADAEVRYLAHDIEECRFYFDRLDPDVFHWSFTVNHAHMLPQGIGGFFRAFGAKRLGEVRLADNRGEKEEHLPPGEGTVDFAATFTLIEGAGYSGQYTLAWGTPDDMLVGRAFLAGL